MYFDKPAGENPIDHLTVVGKTTERIDGPLKVTGTAPYAYERRDIGGRPAYGYVVGATIPKGKISAIDESEARSAPGVLAVVTYKNAGPLGQGSKNVAPLLAGPDVDHYHQAVAIVVAETFEQARYGAARLKVAYDKAPGSFDLEALEEEKAGKAAKSENEPADTAVGEFEAAFRDAPVKLDERYTTPDQSHAMMEPHATIASWIDDAVTVWTASQMVNWHRMDLAKTLGVAEDNVRVVASFIGGGFGGKLFLRADALLAALGSREVKRPVKVALTRPLIFNNTTHRPATRQRIMIGAERDGKIVAIGHESWSGNLEGGRPEAAVAQTRLLYGGPNRMTKMRVAKLDLPEGNAMRAPGEASGMMALEIAMDEMAERLNIDPVEFRIRNDVDYDPEKPKRKFSQRPFVECLRKGAAAFGWDKRNPKPGATRSGDWLTGYGMASAFRNHQDMKSAARVRLKTDGSAVVETDMTDIGTGSYTIIAQTAAETLGLPLHKVGVRLGDSNFPVSCGSGGQFGAVNSTSGVYAACMKLRDMVADRLDLDPKTVEFRNETILANGKSTPLIEAAAKGELVAEDGITFGDLDKTYQLSTFGGHFVEVAVDAWTGESRVRRMLAVCASGRILNPLTARSQVIGAMTMGVGAALSEGLTIDKQQGFFVNHDLASYEVAVHADIPHQEVIFLDEPDPVASPLKAKGVGELGICGVAAAVANAIYNATGVRVRDYPITLDKLIAHMPEAV